jgi:hypothetical protein
MTGCPEWREAVRESALGDAVEPALAAHVAVCPECTDALRECRRLLARTDELLRHRAAVEPPGYGPDRVMARIHGRNASRANPWFRWALGACAAMVLIASVLWTLRPTRRPQPLPANVTTLASWRSPTDVLLQPPVGAAWNAVPRVGDGFLDMKPLGETHAQ